MSTPFDTYLVVFASGAHRIVESFLDAHAIAKAYARETKQSCEIRSAQGRSVFIVPQPLPEDA